MKAEPMTATQAVDRAAELAEQWTNGNHALVLVELANGPRVLSLAFGIKAGSGLGFNPNAAGQFLEMLAQTEDQARLIEGAH